MGSNEEFEKKHGKMSTAVNGWMRQMFQFKTYKQSKMPLFCLNRTDTESSILNASESTGNKKSKLHIFNKLQRVGVDEGDKFDDDWSVSLNSEVFDNDLDFSLLLVIQSAEDIPRLTYGHSELMVKVIYKNRVVSHTKAVPRCSNPVWNDSCNIPIECVSEDALELRLYDMEGTTTHFMGSYLLKVSELNSSETTDIIGGLIDETGRMKDVKLGQLNLTASFVKTNIPSRTPVPGSKFKKKTFKAATLTVVLISGRDLIPVNDTGTADPYVKFKLGKEKVHHSKVSKKTLTPQWGEQFHAKLSPDMTPILSISVWSYEVKGKNLIMGRTDFDMSHLNHEETHSVHVPLEDNAGTLKLLVTITGMDNHDAILTYNTDAERHDIYKQYNLMNSFQDLSNVGWLCVKVIKAQGQVFTEVNQKSSVYCILELLNSQVQTQIQAEPEWNKTFAFRISDVHMPLEISVMVQEGTKTAICLGRICIPLLRIGTRETRWYQLKDPKLNRRVRCAIYLDMDFVFNHIRAAVRTAFPREIKYKETQHRPKLTDVIRGFRNSINRVSYYGDMATNVFNYIIQCLEWSSPGHSFVCFLVYIIVVVNFELYMLPITILILFAKSYIQSALNKMVEKKTEKPFTMADEVSLISGLSDEGEESSEDEVDEKVVGEKPEEKKSWKDRLNVARDTIAQIQDVLDEVASFIERLDNTFTWQVPWLTMMAVIILGVGAIILYFIPLRFLILAGGVNKFTKRLLRPSVQDTNELLNFMSRVPNHKEVMMWKELKLPPSLCAPSTNVSKLSPFR